MSHINRVVVSYSFLLVAIFLAGCKEANEVLPDAGCGIKKTVTLTKVLTPTDRSFTLVTDSGSLSTSCLAHFQLEFGYNSATLQNTSARFELNSGSWDTTAWSRMPIKGLNNRQLMFVDGSWVFNGWSVSLIDRQDVSLIARDYSIDFYDHGSHPGQASTGLGVYSIATQLLQNITSVDSSVYVKATIEYYEGKK